MTDLVGQTLGNYRVEDLLGAGGMGQVFRARHIHLDWQAAIKVMRPSLANDPGFQARFRDEVRAARALQHPHVVEIHDFGEQEGRFYLVMELVPDGSLRTLLHERTRGAQAWPLALGIELICQAADALAFAHAQGIVHRDIKPDNLLLVRQLARAADPPGSNPYWLKVSDFGLARLAESDGRTITSETLGTPAYMSPEQCQGAPLDGRSDIYALGVVLYETVTGQLPFEVKSLSEAVFKHIYATPTPPRQLEPRLPPALDALILRCLAKRADERPASAAALAAALRDLLDDPALTTLRPATSAAPAAPTPRPPTTDRSKRGEVVPRVQVLEGGGQPEHVVELTRAGLTVGKLANSTIVLDGAEVGRNHLRVGWDGEQATVTDLGTRGGTLLDDAPLTPHAPQPWMWGQVLRVGPFALRLDLRAPRGAHPAGAPLGSPITPVPAGGAPAAPLLTGEYVTQPRGSAATSTHLSASALQTGRIKVALALGHETLDLAPGLPAFASVVLTNTGSTLDRIALSIEGLPEGWAQVPAQAIPIAPNTQTATSITVTAPRTPDSLAGVYPVTIRARSQENKVESSVARASWNVQPFSASSAELRPKRAEHARAASYTALIRNAGNAPMSYTLDASDDEQALDYQFGQTQITIPPGHEASVPVTVAAPRRWVGAKQHRFNVRATDAGAAVTHESGTFVHTSIVPLWALPIMLLLLLLLIGGGARFFSDPGSARAEALATATNTATATPSGVPDDTQPTDGATAIKPSATASATATGQPSPTPSSASLLPNPFALFGPTTQTPTSATPTATAPGARTTAPGNNTQVFVTVITVPNAATQPETPKRTATATPGTNTSNSATPQVSVSANTALVTEGQTCQFTISLSVATTNAVSVSYTVAGQNGRDFNLSSTTGTTRIPGGSLSQSLAVQTIDDNSFAGTRAIQISLANPDGATLGTSQDSCTIQDNDSLSGGGPNPVPTTPVPTTPVPTTPVPTTPVPTTPKPTTAVPTTPVPTTPVPTTPKPTTAVPTTLVPTTKPTTAVPTTATPVPTTATPVPTTPVPTTPVPTTPVPTTAVTPANVAPVAADDNDPSYNTNEGSPLTVAKANGVLKNDTDANGDLLIAVKAGNPAHGTLTLNADGSFIYTPNADFNGTDMFTYQANDGKIASNVATVTVIVNPINDAPEFTLPVTTATVNEDAGAQTRSGFATGIRAGPVTATDEAAQIPTLGFNVTANSNAALFSVQPAISAVTGNLTFTPADDANGSAIITVVLKDGGSNIAPNVNISASQTFTINVTAVNDAPEFTLPITPVEGSEGHTEESFLNVVSGIRRGPVTATDEAGQTVAFTLVADKPGLFTVQPTLDGLGTLKFTPAKNANGTATITVVLKDDGSNIAPNVNTSAPKLFNIILAAVNDAPTARDDTASVALGANVKVDVLANDDDNEDTLAPATIGGGGLDASSVTVTAAPMQGSTTINNGPSGDGAITYTPNPGATGSDIFTYQVCDKGVPTPGLCDTAAVTITITSTLNNAPTLAQNTGTTVIKNSARTITPIMLTITDVDSPPLNKLQFTLSVTPTHGLLRKNGNALHEGDSFTQDDVQNNRISYKHNNDNATSDTFQFTFTDGLASNSPIATFNMTVVPTNIAPTLAGTKQLTVNENGTATLTSAMIKINDGDTPPTNQLLYQLESVPDVDTGTLQRNGITLKKDDFFTQSDVDAGNITYVHNGSETPTSTKFQFTYSDGIAPKSANVDFSITITPTNDAPTLTGSKSLTVDEGGTEQLTKTMVQIDDLDNPENERIFTLSSVPSHGELRQGVNKLNVGATFTQSDINGNNNNSIKYIHDGGETTSDSFTFTFKDKTGPASAAQTFNITITPVNDAPKITVPGLQNVKVNTTKGVAGISVADADVQPTDKISVTLKVTSGMLMITPLPLTLSSLPPGYNGTDSKTVTLVGTPTDINTALASVTYHSAATLGTDTISITVDDQGHTGAGGAKTDTKIIAVAITP